MTVNFESGNAIYIFNLANDEGWLICPNTIDACPVIAESDYGHFDETDNQWQEKNHLIKCIGNYLKASNNNEYGERDLNRFLWRPVVKEIRPLTKSEPDTTEVDIFYRTDTLVNETYGPYIQTRWDQYNKFASRTPLITRNPVLERCPAGCANVALAQLAYYTHYESGIPLYMYETSQCEDYYYHGVPYDFSFSNSTQQAWDKMARWPGDSYNDRTELAVAVLISYISHLSQTSYVSMEGETDYDNLSAAARQLGLSGSQFVSYSENGVKVDLRAARPVITGSVVDSTSGHAFIIDGYHLLSLRENEIVCSPSGEVLSETHFDWSYLWWHYNAGDRTETDGGVFWAVPNAYYPDNRKIMTGWSL